MRWLPLLLALGCAEEVIYVDPPDEVAYMAWIREGVMRLDGASPLRKTDGAWYVEVEPEALLVGFSEAQIAPFEPLGAATETVLHWADECDPTLGTPIWVVDSGGGLLDQTVPPLSSRALRVRCDAGELPRTLCPCGPSACEEPKRFGLRCFESMMGGNARALAVIGKDDLLVSKSGGIAREKEGEALWYRGNSRSRTVIYDDGLGQAIFTNDWGGVAAVDITDGSVTASVSYWRGETDVLLADDGTILIYQLFGSARVGTVGSTVTEPLPPLPAPPLVMNLRSRTEMMLLTLEGFVFQGDGQDWVQLPTPGAVPHEEANRTLRRPRFEFMDDGAFALSISPSLFVFDPVNLSWSQLPWPIEDELRALGSLKGSIVAAGFDGVVRRFIPGEVCTDGITPAAINAFSPGADPDTLVGVTSRFPCAYRVDVEF